MTSHPCKRTGRVAPVAPAPGERLVTLAVGAPGSPLDPRGGLLVHPMVQVVTALYSLAHDVGLTREEQGEVERTAPSLNGTLWRHTKALLRAADASPAGTLVDLGYTDLVLRWLGFADERGFEEVHGMGIGEAIRSGPRATVRARAGAGRGPRGGRRRALRRGLGLVHALGPAPCGDCLGPAPPSWRPSNGPSR